VRKPKSVRAVTRRPGMPERELLEFVRTGVEKFILNKVTVEDFFTALRAAADREKNYSHQLTRPVFSRIVRAAIRKRNLTHTV
jgi:Na+-transporting NADH:ubiquinone oxidoreductase subunit NqrA